MDYISKFKNVSVLGAAGKMGSGILSLVSIEAARLALDNNYSDFCINAIDASPEGLLKIKRLIKSLLTKHGEKNIVRLRKYYSDRNDLIENEDVIKEYTAYVFEHINFSTLPEICAESLLIFEAVIEDLTIKSKVISTIEKLSNNKPWYLTNTSSIPINELDSASKLDGRIMGFHFYNPPTVQKLVELISADNTEKELIDFSRTLAEKLNKQIVPSNDIAGFIGNGFFMRDINLAINEMTELKNKTDSQAVYVINTITKDYLLRPMGIFQLIDYVGIDICSLIMTVMKSHFKNENFKTPFLEKYLKEGIRGGQKPDASQRDGIFQYNGGKITGCYDFEKKSYIPIEFLQEQTDSFLADNPKKEISWSVLKRDSDKEKRLKKYFHQLSESETLAAKLSLTYLRKCRRTGEFLVENSTAGTADDVNTVLKSGFYHLYGPVNDFLKEEAGK